MYMCIIVLYSPLSSLSLPSAMGHPLAASGSRITAHLVHELRRTGQRLAVGSACIGGGQGIAVLLERVD